MWLPAIGRASIKVERDHAQGRTVSFAPETGALPTGQNHRMIAVVTDRDQGLASGKDIGKLIA